MKNGENKKAIAEYKRLLKFDPKKPERYLIQPRYHYELARVYEQVGQHDNAIGEYTAFLDIWKNADADLPEFIDAKNRLAALVSEEKR